jgi:hypothetical protein
MNDAANRFKAATTQESLSEYIGTRTGQHIDSEIHKASLNESIRNTANKSKQVQLK